MNKISEKPLILIGAQRSGTTILAHLISEAYQQNQGCFTVNGKLLYFLKRWLTDNDIKNFHFRADEIIYSLRRKKPYGKNIDFWLGNVEEVLNKYSGEIANGKYENANSIELTRKIIMECYAPYHLWGDKYNEYLNDLPYINCLFPKAKYILLYRNPFEVSESTLKWSRVQSWRPSDTDKNIVKWVRWHDSWFNLLAKINKEDILVLNYKKLCEGEETKRISQFLNCDFEDYIGKIHPNKKLKIPDGLPSFAEKTWDKLTQLNNLQGGYSNGKS